MAFLEKVIGKKEEIDMEEFLNNIDVEEETSFEDADAFVKPISLNKAEDTKLIVEEAKQGNIILMDIGDLSKRNAIKLREFITEIKEEIQNIDGDIARISHDRILVTPSKVKIVKKKTS